MKPLTLAEATQRVQLIRALMIIGFEQAARVEADKLHIDALAIPLDHPQHNDVLSTALQTVLIEGL